MKRLTIIFFGSFQTYSVQVLEHLAQAYEVTAVISTPPKPAGRNLALKSTDVEIYARKHDLPIFTPETLEAIPDSLMKPDFIVVAGYGKLIPANWLAFNTIMAVNIHFSLLPEYRGAFPAEWAILRGEKKTGVTLIHMSAEFDKGEMLAKRSIPIEADDTRETLYKKLYDLGGILAVAVLPKIKSGEIIPKPQPQGEFFYARKISRDEGFIAWDEFVSALIGDSSSLSTKFRALIGWPGVWTTITNSQSNTLTKQLEGKRLKLVAMKPEIMVQLEGKNPTSWKQFQEAYLR